VQRSRGKWGRRDRRRRGVVEAGSLLNGIPYSALQRHLAPTMELH
jgi:hypothetical protein